MSQLKVLVTGANGFIATHVIDRLLANGFEVVGTGRNEAKIAALLRLFKKKYPEAKLHFEKTPDISKLDAFDDALKNHPDIKYVAHLASPITAASEDATAEENFITPAVNGVLGLFNGIKKYGPQVEKVSMVSSFAACMQFLPEHSNVFLDETTWNDISLEMVFDDGPHLGYAYSKKAAEEAAWDFVKKEKPSFKLTTVLPPIVIGPQVFDELVTDKFEGSNEIIFGFLDKKGQEFSFPFPASISTHVRDIAQSVIKPFGTDKLDGKRIIPVESSYNPQDIVDKVHKFFPYVNGKIATGNPGSEGVLYKYDTSASDKLLEIEYIPLDTQIIETFSQFNYVNGKF
ncbi:oxidoreductase activity protein [[Candida] boidinii]|nr:oxidoreductase activity protein [[Candida] boidinii]OWB61125.1 oxidoreductase activity protein [[Candida] boidinii]OWB73102.1 oxidoreductase activity protein [[Candida] boidinii]